MSDYLRLTRGDGRAVPEFVIVRADAVIALRKSTTDQRTVVTLTGGSLLYVTEDVPTIAAMLGFQLDGPRGSGGGERPPWATIAQVGIGTRLVAGDGFTCLAEDTVVTVAEDEFGLFVPCDEGRHRLDGQLDDGDAYIGFTLAEPLQSNTLERAP